jgi:O-antigen/teichoic acid export membrane protein
VSDEWAGDIGNRSVITSSMRAVRRRLLAWLERLRAPMGPSETARSDTRHLRILLTASSAAAAKAVSVAVQLAMVPLMLSALGDYSYGVWLTLQSVIGFGAFADLGIGNGAMNNISAAQARGDHERINRIITSAVAMLTGLAICGMAVAPAMFLWMSGHHVGGGHAPDVAVGIAVFTCYFALSLPLGFIERVNAALQEGSVTNIARCVVAVATLASTWGVTRAGGSFGAICAATLAPQLVVWALVWAVEFRRRGWLRVGHELFDRKLARSLLGVGMLFLGLQVLAAFNWQIDNILIASLLGAEHVTPYGVQVRVFSLVGTIASTVLTPLWPAYADAVAHGDHAWIRTTLRRSLIGAVAVSAPLAFAAAAALPLILRVWTGGSIKTTPMLAYGLASLTVCQTVCAALAIFSNGTSAIRPQLILGLALVTASLPIKIYTLKRYGIEPIGAVTAILTIAIVLIPAWLLVRGSFSRPQRTNV